MHDNSGDPVVRNRVQSLCCPAVSHLKGKGIKYAINLMLLLLATVTTAEDNRSWYAIAHPTVGDPEYFTWYSYGVAWDFPTKAAAIATAVAECDKRSRSKCKAYAVDHDHCFAIIRSGRRGDAPGFYLHTGSDTFLFISSSELFQTEEETRRLATEEIRESMRRSGRWNQSDLELVACSGDPRNRRANQ